MKYELVGILCAWILGSDGREEKLCAYFAPEEPQQMSLSECRDERVNLRIISARQGLTSIIFCALPENREAPSADREGS